MGVKLLSLDELLEVSDFITVHLPKTPETVGLIGDEALHKVKPTRAHRQRRARRDRRRGGAGRRAQGGPGRRRRPRRVREGAVHGLPALRVRPGRRTPHLGASTDEAQEKAGIAVARSVRLALAGELVPGRGQRPGRRHRRGRQARPAARREARPDLHRARGRGRGPPRRRGVRRDHPARREGAGTLRAQGRLRGRRRRDGVVRQRPAVRAGARRRGPADHQLGVARPPQRGHRARHPRRTARRSSVSGTLAGPKHLQKIVAVGEYDVDLALADHMVVLRYEDRPGVVGTRRPHPRRGRASTSPACRSPVRRRAARRWPSLTVDDTVPPRVLAEIAEEIGATLGPLGEPGLRLPSLWGLCPRTPVARTGSSSTPDGLRLLSGLLLAPAGLRNPARPAFVCPRCSRRRGSPQRPSPPAPPRAIRSTAPAIAAPCIPLGERLAGRRRQGVARAPRQLAATASAPPRVSWAAAGAEAGMSWR